MELTSGFELTTSITNIFIFVVSLISFIKIKKNSMWKFFFFCMCICSFLGVIVHGIEMSQNTNNILWAILSLCFTITINTLLCIFMNLRYKHMIILSVLLSILLCTQLLLDLNFILTFTLYVLLVLILCTYYILKSDNRKLYLIGFFITLIGGILMLSKCKISILNHNGLCHVFMAVGLVFLYLGSKKEIDYN